MTWDENQQSTTSSRRLHIVKMIVATKMKGWLLNNIFINSWRKPLLISMQNALNYQHKSQIAQYGDQSWALTPQQHLTTTRSHTYSASMDWSSTWPSASSGCPPLTFSDTASPKIGPPPVEVGHHHQDDMIRLFIWRGTQAVGKRRLATAYFLQRQLRSNDRKSCTFDSKVFVPYLSIWLPLRWHRKGCPLRDWLRPHSSRPSRRAKCSVLQDSSHWAGIGGRSLWQGQHSTPVGCCQPPGRKQPGGNGKFSMLFMASLTQAGNLVKA